MSFAFRIRSSHRARRRCRSSRSGELPASGVRRERGEPVAVRVGEPQLRAGVWSFGADDDPHPVGPTGQVEQPGQFGDPRAVPRLPVGVVCGGPGRCGMVSSFATHVQVRLNPTEYGQRWPVSQVRNSWVPPAPSVRISTFRPGRRPGSVDGSCRQCGLGDLDVIDRGIRCRRCPLRRIIATGSPVPPSPWSTHAPIGW